MHQTPNDEKLRELILYVSKKSETDAAFGATKLNKLLFFCDFMAFGELGRSITGHEYEKLDHGPAPRQIRSTIRSLIVDGALEKVTSGRATGIQSRTVAKRDANVAVFSRDELHFIDKIISKFSQKTGNFLSEQSHKFAGWKYAEKGETIPYEIALIGSRAPTAKELDWGVSLKGLARECLARET